MFAVQALYSFSKSVIEQQNQKQQQNNQQKVQQKILEHQKCSQRQQQPSNLNQNQAENYDNNQQNSKKRLRSKSQQKQLQDACKSQKQQQNASKQQENNQITYLKFQKGDKILVIQSYQNGWWYGNTLKQPQIKGFFPSNYIQVTANKPKPPPPPPSDQNSDQEESQQVQIFNPNEQGIDWINKQLKNINKGPVNSSYYLGIKGYKNVKIDQKNQNILKGDHVKFDVNTGLAKVPIKDQAPAAKSVRQMGYFFDYHQWVEQRNKNQAKKARPDIRRKKLKKLKLKGMD